MPNPGIGDELTAKIQGRILAGDKPADIALDFGVSYSTVSRAKAKIPSDVLERMDNDRVDVISDLIMMQLETGLEASITIAKQAQNEEWRNEQTAAHLATFYGVVTDKSIRLLEASENAANARAVAATATIDDLGTGSPFSN